MSNMPSRRKNLKTKAHVESPKIPEKSTKVIHQVDISTFFKKQDEDESSSDSVRSLPEGALPSPDDAALPCSTTLGSSKMAEKSKRETNQIDESPLSTNEANLNIKTSVSAEEAQKFSDMTNKNHNTESKKRNKKQTQFLRNSQLTDFFPIRRSNRKTLPKVIKEKHQLIEDAILSGNEDGFEVKDFPGKGRGIVTINSIKRGDFVLEYSGELIDYEEALRREEAYSLKENTGCYMYYFKSLNKRYCIDATKESGRLGRLINHSKKGNLKTQPFYIRDSPRLVLVASRDIDAGEELSYDYGDRSKQALESHPWLAL